MWSEDYPYSFTDNTISLNNCTPIPVLRPEFIRALQVSVSIVSILSVFGASLIILTYVAFKDLRTVARELLVHLSIADICVASSHLVGVTVNLPKYVSHPCSMTSQPIDYLNDTDLTCKIQGGVAMFGTVASFLWTIAVAIYLLILIVFERPRFGKYLRIVFYIVCWGVPAVLVIVFGFKNYLGFEEGIDVGWCYVKWIHNGSSNSMDTPNRLWEPQVLGYEIWVYATYIALPLIYIWIRCYVRIKLSRVHNHLPVSAKLQSKARLADLKLTFVPLIFLLLRIWGTILGIPLLYLDFSKRLAFRGKIVNAVLVFLSGVGSSAQGLMNAILFCALTSVVRKKILRSAEKICCYCCRSLNPKKSNLKRSPSTSSDQQLEDTTQYEEEDKMGGERVFHGVHNHNDDDDDVTHHLLSSNYSVQQYNSIAKHIRNGTE